MTYLITTVFRLKYYFAWTLSETISNISGLGFAGLDASGNPKWTLMSNVDIFGFENSLSLRDGIQAWNKLTETWLRRMVYERVPKAYSVTITYLLSALWHGFHPAYYFTFLTGAIFTIASRFVRRTFRPKFVGEARSKVATFLYHSVTWLSARIALSYMALPFILLDLKMSLKVFSHMYFYAHIGALLLIFLGPKLFHK